MRHTLLENGIALPQESGLPASTAARGNRDPLRLNIQFFAEDPPGNQDPPDNQQNPPGDPPPPDDEVSLADLIKQYPHLKKELNSEKAAAVSKRFKNYDFDLEEARAAIAEKKEREKNKGNEGNQTNQEIDTLKGKTSKLEAKTKSLAVAAYAASNGLDAKLITRLAAPEIAGLRLDDNFEIDPDDIETIVDGLRAEFPNQFTVKAAGDDGTPPPPPKKQGAYVPGPTGQRTNTPPPGTPDGVAEMEESYKRIQARYNRGKKND